MHHCSTSQLLAGIMTWAGATYVLSHEACADSAVLCHALQVAAAAAAGCWAAQPAGWTSYMRATAGQLLCPPGCFEPSTNNICSPHKQQACTSGRLATPAWSAAQVCHNAWIGLG
jgi:hypothetical protein